MEDRFRETGVIAVVVLEDAENAVPVAQALVAGGVPIVEITLRTAAAPDAIARIASEVPDALIGAGTVLSADQVALAAAAGAAFVVSPGLHEPVVAECRKRQLPVFPGVATATETQAAWNMGLRTLKFFPAAQAGGISMLKALGSVFRDVRFIPTGGVSASNLGGYLELQSVTACGGSWLTPADKIAAGEFDSITRLAREAGAIVRDTRG